MTEVVNKYKHKHDPSSDVYIGRGSKWGNPFVIGKDGTRDEVIEKYRNWIKGRRDLSLALDELIGKTLVCFCRPQKCHGDVLVEMVDEWRLWKKTNLIAACEEINRISSLWPALDTFNEPTQAQLDFAEKIWKDTAKKFGLDVDDLKTFYQDY